MIVEVRQRREVVPGRPRFRRRRRYPPTNVTVRARSAPKRAVEKVAKLQGKIRRQRLDHAHKTALSLVREHGFIAYEDLKIRNMTKAPAPKPDPGRPGSFLPDGAGSKAGLNRSIADAGWGGVSRDPERQG
ncbi:hypothetical protein GCM10010276_13760 [Streptomyces longisporus]|uniref:Probable transposase IS891/IS1136/IS1341 domain-containing protein n=1 Tax=Streptomyces longisporus TaxID=1948 RepID=A0ABN3L9X2_STRLO